MRRPFFIGHLVEHRIGLVELLVLFGGRCGGPWLTAGCEEQQNEYRALRHCERSEAIQIPFLDCRVAPLLAMTASKKKGRPGGAALP